MAKVEAWGLRSGAAEERGLALPGALPLKEAPSLSGPRPCQVKQKPAEQAHYSVHTLPTLTSHCFSQEQVSSGNSLSSYF